MTKKFKHSVFQESDEDHLSFEDPVFLESLTTTLWEPEGTDDTAEGNRCADMRDAGYRDTNTGTNPSPPVVRQQVPDNEYKTAEECM